MLLLNATRTATNNPSLVKAETALLHNNRAEAEAILLQAGLVLDAVRLNLQLFQFDRALQLAVKYDAHLDLVLAGRRKYLQQFAWTETNVKFVEYSKKVGHYYYFPSAVICIWKYKANKIQIKYLKIVF